MKRIDVLVDASIEDNNLGLLTTGSNVAAIIGGCIAHEYRPLVHTEITLNCGIFPQPSDISPWRNT